MARQPEKSLLVKTRGTSRTPSVRPDSWPASFLSRAQVTAVRSSSGIYDITLVNELGELLGVTFQAVGTWPQSAVLSVGDDVIAWWERHSEEPRILVGGGGGTGSGDVTQQFFVSGQPYLSE